MKRGERLAAAGRSAEQHVVARRLCASAITGHPSFLRERQRGEAAA